MEHTYQNKESIDRYPGVGTEPRPKQLEYISQTDEFANFLLAFDPKSQNEALEHLHRRIINIREIRIKEIDEQIECLNAQKETILDALNAILK